MSNHYAPDDITTTTGNVVTTAIPASILWSCVSRNDTILAEAGNDPYEGVVLRTAKELLAKPPTPGFEFHTSSSSSTSKRFMMMPFGKGKNTNKNTASMIVQDSGPPPVLKGIKLHIYEEEEDDDDDDLERKFRLLEGGTTQSQSYYEPELRIWIFAAVYDPRCIGKVQVQAFLEKMVELTVILRETTEWKTCPTLGVHNVFAPVLQQRMEQVVVATKNPKIAAVEEKLYTSQQILERNIDLILERGERLEALREQTTRLEDMSAIFKKRAKKVRRMKMMQNAKHGLVLGTVVTATVAVCVIPPLVALL